MFKNIIYLNYISFYKINKKQQLKYLNILLYLFKKYNNIIFKFIKLPKKKKHFCLIKSPKCYKNSKLLISYKYFKYIYIYTIKQKKIKINNIFIYFDFLKNKFGKYQTIFSKNTKITIKLIVDYNLKV